MVGSPHPTNERRRKMESSHKQRGFMRAKLATSLNRTSNSSSFSGNIKRSATSSIPSIGYIVKNDEKPSMVIKGDGTELDGGDDSIDKRAAMYISCVQQRFRLE
ncbi:hypothetical protein QJS04_geneDACA015451 [Acorus gramineus]|uniref:Uncharacterized protein n=1 Tax=Acorus gramineus TaxID=55184 RepID=A0AAV9A4A4_ACOGR|nr:hypothetical protein QJS04_geneDACA015451 [Acorus gramineus]